jgi:hypothetical protein
MQKIIIVALFILAASCKKTSTDSNPYGKYFPVSSATDDKQTQPSSTSYMDDIVIDIRENGIVKWEDNSGIIDGTYTKNGNDYVFGNGYVGKVDNNPGFTIAVLSLVNVYRITDGNGDGLDDIKGYSVGNLISDTVRFRFEKK